MKKTVLLVAALACAFSASIFAETKIGVLDLNKVLANAPQVKAMRVKLKNKFDPRGEELVAMQKSLKADVDKYNKDSQTMKDDELKAEQSKLVDKQKELQDKQASFQKDLMAAQSDAMKTVLGKVQKIVKKVAAKNDLDLVVTMNSTAYNNPSLDITDQVSKALSN